MKNSKSQNSSLHHCHVHTLRSILYTTHSLCQSIAIIFILYFRATFFFENTYYYFDHQFFLRFSILCAELSFSFFWFLKQPFYWRPVTRTVFPENLPNELPGIDVFICTADPNKEPTFDVMNTVVSAMALDYPAEKLCVYLSDDAYACVTLDGMKEAWVFATWWLPFVRRYGVKSVCPKAYFEQPKEGCEGNSDYEFIQEKNIIKEKYEAFKSRVQSMSSNDEIIGGPKTSVKDHPAHIQVIDANAIEDETAIINTEDNVDYMPSLVYVSREKRPSHPHHFKAGALNVLLRVSATMSDSPYILVLDCDMYCNDSISSRQAMCFFLDPKISPTLGWVQYPQTFHNVNEHDIYDSQMRYIWTVYWPGADGLQGPTISGTNFYINRKALYGFDLYNDEAKRHLAPIMSGEIPQDDYRKMLAIKAMKTAPEKRAENKASKKPSNAAKPKPTVTSRKRQQTSQGDAGKSKKNKAAEPPMTQAEQAKDDMLASGQLSATAALSLPPSGGEPPTAGGGLIKTQTKKQSSATKGPKGKNITRPSPGKKLTVPQIVPQIDVGQVLENVETAIEGADPNAGIPEALLEKVKLEIDDVIDFTEGRTGPSLDIDDLGDLPSSSRVSAKEKKKMVNEMLKCTAEGYEQSLRGYNEAHITPIMLNLVEALVRMGGLSLWTTALRRQSKEVVSALGDVQEYVHKRVNFINYEQHQAEMSLSAELTQLQCQYATLVDENKKLVERCEERQKEAEDAHSRTLLADEACQAALSAKMQAETARQQAEAALKQSEEQRKDIVDAAVASAVASHRAEKEKLQNEVADLKADVLQQKEQAMAAFEAGESAMQEYWDEAYAWAHGDEPQVSLSLVQKYVKYLQRKANCALAGMDPPSPFDADAADDEDKPSDDEDEEEEEEDGAEHDEGGADE